jgi:mannose-1-phosphate guanylyltransferase
MAKPGGPTKGGSDFVVIMAGGAGRRLWPLSRQNRPKHLLPLFDGKSLMQLCYQRVSGLVEPERILVLTNRLFVDAIREAIPELPTDNLVAEPEIRDTAAAIGLAATIVSSADPDAAMAVVTADQLIEPAEDFRTAARDALRFVHDHPQAMVTFAVKPTFASTQFGYIKLGPATKHDGCVNAVSPVAAFKEKPNEATAQQYFADGGYAWNSGMFVWKAETILGHLRANLPAAVEPLEAIGKAWKGRGRAKALAEWFGKIPKISIDYAVMEKAPQVHAIRLDCRWHDLGSFVALAEVIDLDERRNLVVAENRELLDSRDNIIVSGQPGHLVACIGVKNMLVVHSADATLVCPIEEAGRLKELLDRIQKSTGEKYL